MRRRRFVFRSLQASLLLSPLLAWRRRASAAGAPPVRALFMVTSSGYPEGSDFFPAAGRDFTLPPILENFTDLRDQMTIVDGLDIRPSGPRPRNDHVRGVAKVLTAKDYLDTGNQDGEPGGPSVDHLIAEARGLRTLELNIHEKQRNHMRARPFASGPRAFKSPILSPADAWDQVFRDFEPGARSAPDPAAAAARRNRLLARRSVLDDLRGELARFRAELGGIERLKLDILEDSIRRAENSVARDLELGAVGRASVCEVPDRAMEADTIPARFEAHYDLAYAAMACERSDVVGIMYAHSGYDWSYRWVGVDRGSIHDNVHHPGRRPEWIASSRWDWDQLGDFVRRLRDTPEGSGTMLDQTLVVGLGCFGRHHNLERIPFVLFGSAGGQLEPGQCIALGSRQTHDKGLTSVAHLMGAPLVGIGDDPSCGPLPELFAGA